MNNITKEVCCEIVVGNLLINSCWYRNGEFLLSRYIPNIIVDLDLSILDF